ncbi:hypothetical protein ACFQFH_05505 [Halobaculum halobium]|uniref:Uncharacterized protein n=1 Tax=Halobaculum halobium TaxID=3032281 RepID=A0ABD5T9U1_9EURY|nr:hypothetical protein [Halobaculum sp. SYNS20]
MYDHRFLVVYAAFLVIVLGTSIGFLAMVLSLFRLGEPLTSANSRTMVITP